MSVGSWGRNFKRYLESVDPGSKSIALAFGLPTKPATNADAIPNPQRIPTMERGPTNHPASQRSTNQPLPITSPGPTGKSGHKLT